MKPEIHATWWHVSHLQPQTMPVKPNTIFIISYSNERRTFQRLFVYTLRDTPALLHKANAEKIVHHCNSHTWWPAEPRVYEAISCFSEMAGPSPSSTILNGSMHWHAFASSDERKSISLHNHTQSTTRTITLMRKKIIKIVYMECRRQHLTDFSSMRGSERRERAVMDPAHSSTITW